MNYHLQSSLFCGELPFRFSSPKMLVLKEAELIGKWHNIKGSSNMQLVGNKS
jgi:hypothetical protein